MEEINTNSENLIEDNSSLIQDDPINTNPQEPTYESNPYHYQYSLEIEIQLSSKIFGSLLTETDIDIAHFSLSTTSPNQFKWDVYHHLTDIKESAKSIEKEFNKKERIISNDLLLNLQRIQKFSISEIKQNIQLIKTVYSDLLNRANDNVKLREFFEISNVSFSKFNQGIKPKEGYCQKKAEVKTCRRLFNCFCSCMECVLFNKFNKRWIVLKDDMLFYMNSSLSETGKNIYWFDDKLKVEKEGNQILRVQDNSNSITIKFETEFECALWHKQIQEKVENFKQIMANNKYASYTNQKTDNVSEWFIDGKSYFNDLRTHLLQAQETVFITDWWLSPEVWLDRPVQYNVYQDMKNNNIKTKREEPSRLMDILYTLALRGVEVYILVYCEMTLALTLNSKHSKDTLQDLHDNIKVCRHPKDSLDLLWSHHEKLVVIDQRIGYVGGLDLCWGRYDTNNHPLYEPPNQTQLYEFPGIDYSNARICDFSNVQNYLVESVSRSNTHRMPWHDVHIRLEGPAVADIARHFVERWNYAKFESRNGMIIGVASKSDIKTETNANTEQLNQMGWLGNLISNANQKLPSKLEQTNIIQEDNNNDNDNEEQLLQTFIQGKTIIDEDHLMQPKSAYNNFVRGMAKKQQKTKSWFEPRHAPLQVSFNIGFLRAKGAKAKVQVLRSGSLWSIGLKKKENSILNAYRYLIKKAKHYIYIENQFFISKPYNQEDKQQCSSLPTIVENDIACCITERILQAIDENKPFKVFVFIPLLPGFAGEPETSSTLQIILKHTYHTISKCKGYSMLEKIDRKLKQIGSIKTVDDYIGFYSLRTHAQKSPNDPPVTELIYIHSKLMIVDDTKVLIGSANINDRSMLGSRDSEYAVVVKHTKNHMSIMNGERYKCSFYAKSFRKALMAEHLGLKKMDRILDDPLNEKLNTLFKQRAEQNTELYRKIFACYPDDQYTTFQELKQGLSSAPKGDNLIELYNQNKDKIKGHIVEFPLKFLEQEKLGMIFFSVENLVPEKNFT